MTNLSPTGGTISAISVSKSNPEHRLVYGVYRSDEPPQIYKIDDAVTATDNSTNLDDISFVSAADGAYINRIVINPKNADEMIVVMSNYEIIGLYHTTDGGNNWQAIEGNLEGGGDPGPSMRDAAIIPNNGSPIYMVATSTGIYSTSALNGNSTTWSQEGSNTIGNVVSTSVAHRVSDNTIAVGTHGRGMFGKLPKERLVDGDAGWRMMSAPVANMAISDITDEIPIQGFGDGEEKNFYTGYNGTNFTAPSNLSGNLTSGKGFIIYLYDNNQAGSSPLPVPISSEENEPSGDITVDLHSSGDRYNLVGNPYNATIDFDQLSRNEVEDKWWVWDDATSQYYTYNGNTGVTEVNNNGHIAPWQGFFVRAAEGSSNPYLTFSQDDKAHYDSQFYKENDEVMTISFSLEGEELIDDNTVAVFYEDGKTEADPGDMAELISLNNEYISLAFTAEHYNSLVSLSNEARSPNVRKNEFNLGLEGSRKGEYQLEWELQNIPDEWDVQLFDRKTGENFNLKNRTHFDFSFDQAQKLQKRGRFSKNVHKSGEQESVRFKLTVINGNIEKNLPSNFSLTQNYPNPFNPTTSIPYELPERAEVSIKIYNVLGQEIRTLVNNEQPAGFHEVSFNATDLASGLYFYRIKASDFVETKSMTLIK